MKTNALTTSRLFEMITELSINDTNVPEPEAIRTAFDEFADSLGNMRLVEHSMSELLRELIFTKIELCAMQGDDAYKAKKKCSIVSLS